eukprot:scpid25193/ scgid7267/ Meiotically up-regulated gene 158 protein
MASTRAVNGASNGVSNGHGTNGTQTTHCGPPVKKQTGSRNPNLGLHSAGVVLNGNGGSSTSSAGSSSAGPVSPTSPFDPECQPSWMRNCRGNDSELFGERQDSWWSGVKPVPGVPGVRSDGTVFSLPQANAATFSRQQILEYFQNTWMLTETLFSSLQGEEAFYRPPYHNLRHPMIFYYAHPASLYVNKFRVAGLLKEAVNAEYEVIFETGVDEMSWDDMDKNEMQWPSVQDTMEYRKTVYNIIVDLIKSHPALDDSQRPFNQDKPAWAIFMGFEHERIHFETSSVLIRELPVSVLKQPVQWPAYHPSVLKDSSDTPTPGKDYQPAEMIPVSSTSISIHKPDDFPSFGWDNEYGRRDFTVEPFKSGNTLCTNGEFWEFVRSGGYFDQSVWTDDGWAWRTYRNVKFPTFWVPHGPTGLHHYHLRLIFDILPMPWDWPVSVNYYEAKAYANWLCKKRNLPAGNIRLPAEQEMYAISDLGGSNDDPVVNAGGDTIADKFSVNGQLAYGSESPVQAMKSNSKGFYDTLGNVWEWGEGYFCALPGFKIHPYYEDFSTPCFDGQHSVFQNGSFASTGNLLSRHARYHFRSHFYQFSGFRLVEAKHLETSDMDAPPPYVGGKPWATKKPKQGHALYETSCYIHEYLSLHFAEPADLFPHDGIVLPGATESWPKRCSELSFKYCPQGGRALDLGCAVGRASFELARKFDKVIGIDFSAAFVETCQKLQKHGKLPYTQKVEGNIRSSHEAVVDPNIDRNRCKFEEGDACALRDDLGDFDAVLMLNLLCRLPKPQVLLERLVTLVRPGGIAIFTSPCTWMDDFTPQSQWLGGYKDESTQVDVRASSTITKVLGDNFELLYEASLPLVIREHYRKYQLIMPHVAVYRRK